MAAVPITTTGDALSLHIQDGVAGKWLCWGDISGNEFLMSSLNLN